MESLTKVGGWRYPSIKGHACPINRNCNQCTIKNCYPRGLLPTSRWVMGGGLLPPVTGTKP